MSVPENEKNNVPSTTEDVVFINRDELTQHFMFTRNRPVKKEVVEQEVVEQKVEQKQEENVDEAIVEETTVEAETEEPATPINEDEYELESTAESETDNMDLSTTQEEVVDLISDEEYVCEQEETVSEDSEESYEEDIVDQKEFDEVVEAEEAEPNDVEIIVDKEIFQKTINSNREKFENKKKMQQMISKIASGCLWTVGIFLLILCCSNLYQQMFNASNYTGFFGIGNAIVVSNSMEPNINVNDLVFYHNTDIDNITSGDVIVYKSKRPNEEERLIVHRVIDIADGYVTTQGDNNATPDAAIEYENVVGKYMFRIGGIGAFFSLMSTKWAPLIAVAIIWFIIISRIAIYFVHKKKTIESITTNENNREALDHFFNF